MSNHYCPRKIAGLKFLISQFRFEKDWNNINDPYLNVFLFHLSAYILIKTIVIRNLLSQQEGTILIFPIVSLLTSSFH